MKLEDIGFYTLSDDRAKYASCSSRLYRAEMLITGNCNFNCGYCRHIGGPDIQLGNAYSIIDRLANDNLFALRLSGGEPTTHPQLLAMVQFSKNLGIEKIAISTNGSAKTDLYKELIDAGVNDFSLSLDACCGSEASKMSGGVDVWDLLIHNIEEISKLAYITIGTVITQDNQNDINDIIKFASGLGVSDIRVIPAAQDASYIANIQVDEILLSKHPILKYRVHNMINGVPVRGLSESDYHQCPLVLDDVAILGDQHYPCIIYMRENGSPIGDINDNMRNERKLWYEQHNTFTDQICRHQCLDVCKCYNNRFRSIKNGEYISQEEGL